jgi:hypothetical protein
VNSLRGRAPRGQSNPAWTGSAVNVEDLRSVSDQAGLELLRVEDPGTQYTTVLAIRR